MSEIIIFTGLSGSGKTEISINYAIKEALKGKKTTLIDIDIVNPYFCAREHSDKLKNEYGIDVISSNKEYNNAELMVLDKSAISKINSDTESIIIDVGGDKEGAKALAQYSKYIIFKNYEMYFVLNSARPQTIKYIDAIKYIREIENYSNLKVTSLISNTHYREFTSKEDIIRGDNETEKLSKLEKVPYKYLTCTENHKDEVENNTHSKVFILELKVKLPFD